METAHKKVLKSISLELRHLLEGSYDAAGDWHPGDLEQRLAAIGVRRDRAPVKVDELPHLSPADCNARQVVDAYLQLRGEAGVDQAEAVAEFVRETAYTWANRLLALRCMEARELIDEVILQKPIYGGRSLEHHRLAQRQPELCAGEDDGLLAVLDKVFVEQARHLPMLFDPDAPGVALKPSPAAIKRCMALLSDSQKVGDEDVATSDVFKAPDAFGWAYQYWNTEEKDRVFEKVRTQKGAKIEGADIIPATQLYTEPYMVKFLVQNSLGATWMGMHPESKLCDTWEYYVRDADRAPVEKKAVAEITFLDPACGSGHFLLEAFDLFYDMYTEEGQVADPDAICRSILEKNLFGIDIDSRAVQIAEVALWMKAAERAFGFEGKPTNLVASVASHLKGPLWEEFLTGFEREPSVARVLRRFGQAMEHIDELGSLARPDEDLRAIIHEEHATWEHQVAQQKEANFLFPEMAEDKLSAQLPFHEVSDDEFAERMLYRARAAIHSFTEQATKAGILQSRFLGSEAATGFRLLDALSRRYDVVAANPPYMGSGNMGNTLKAHVFRHFPTGKRDLYAAFVLRAFQFAFNTSRVALVTQQSWMFLKSYADLRTNHSATPRTTPGLLDAHTAELIAHLGTGSFGDIGGAVVNCALSVFASRPPTPASVLTVFRLIGVASADEKAQILRNRKESNRLFRVSQVSLSAIPSAPVVYWAGRQLLDRLATGPFLSSIVDARPGIQTSNNPRFLRYHWEVQNVPGSSRWYGFSRGGGYKKWHGLQYEVADWQHAGARMKRFNERTGDHWSRNLRNIDYLFRSGLAYSQMNGGSVGCRVLDPFPIFDVRSIAVFPRDGQSRDAILALLNSRYVSYAGRLLTQSLDLPAGYLGRIPLVQLDSAELAPLVQFALSEKEGLVGADMQEYRFNVASLLASPDAKQLLLRRSFHEAVLLIIEGCIEKEFLRSAGLDSRTVESILTETGAPAGWLPLIEGFSDFPTDEQIDPAVSCKLVQEVTHVESRALQDDESAHLWRNLRSVFEAGPGAGYECEPDDDASESVDDDDNESEASNSGIPVPSEFLVEELSRAVKVHPLSVYLALKSGVEYQGWRCLDKERRLTTDRITVLTLRAFGHLWPQQLAASEPAVEWADRDGIIPLSAETHEATLIERIRTHVADELVGCDATSLEREFAELLDKALDRWLATDFFKYHIGQFRKRPVVWQVQSGKITARADSAFACLIYYHKVDGDLLEKIRAQYVGPLRQRWETELRGIESIAPDARSDRQTSRHTALGDLIKELQDFDTCLRGVQESGFETDSLRRFAIQDGLLCMKAQWLRRLSTTIQAGPLAGWKSEAASADIYDDLPDWIDEAMIELDHRCSHVGPEQWKSPDDPTPVSLAALICKDPASLVAKALEHANGHWWSRLDSAVLSPLRQEINQKKEKLKGIKAELKQIDDPDSDEAATLEMEEARLKREVRELKEQLDAATEHAEELRDKIAGWKCPEAAGWEPWLASQPMYDAISSVDGRRRAPTTVVEWVAQERSYVPDINDGVRVNIAPLQKAGLLAADVLAKKDLDKAIADRADWRSDERRWCREGKLPQPGWWPEKPDSARQEGSSDG